MDRLGSLDLDPHRRHEQLHVGPGLALLIRIAQEVCGMVRAEHLRSPPLVQPAAEPAQRRTGFQQTFAATAPRQQMNSGSIASSWASRYGRQLAISSGCGVRLFGGRHLIVFKMYTSDRFKPHAAMILSSNWPAAPTNGTPCRSSSRPGASPMNTSLAWGVPSPKTVRVRVRASSSHKVHWDTLRASRARAATRGSGWPGGAAAAGPLAGAEPAAGVGPAATAGGNSEAGGTPMPL